MEPVIKIGSVALLFDYALMHTHFEQPRGGNYYVEATALLRAVA